MTIPDKPIKLYLTKYETGKIYELLCPKCNGEIKEAANRAGFWECNGCNNYFAVDWDEEVESN